MNQTTIALAVLLIGTAACNQQEPQRDGNFVTLAPKPPSPAPKAPPPPAATPEAKPALPDDRAPLEEPHGPIDPKSIEAAGQVVQHYGASIEQKRWAEGEKLWGEAATAGKFTAELKAYADVHFEVGKPSDPDGAAGSIYVTVPVILYGHTTAGAAFIRAADVVLRRVNDVPGSSEAQRRWHIERIDWKNER